MTITRFTLALFLPNEVNTLRTALMGQIRMIPRASRNVLASTSSEPAAAIPAPGPM